MSASLGFVDDLAVLDEECSTCGNTPCPECYCGSGECPEDCEHCDECDHPVDACSCCPDCLKSYCVCCDECGTPGCDGECYDNDESSMGVSTDPPWVHRGIKVVRNPKQRNWRQVWPELDYRIDPVQVAADFYLLEAISNNIPNRIDGVAFKPIRWLTKAEARERLRILMPDASNRQIGAHVRWRERNLNNSTVSLSTLVGRLLGEARYRFERLVDEIDPILIAYFHMACAGEARHHRAIGGRVLPTDRGEAWAGWREVYEQIGPDSILDLAVLFEEFGGGSFGGTPWANAARILHARVVGGLDPHGNPESFTSKMIFLDRAWTLQHNGGCFLNKVGWGQNNPAGWPLDYLQTKVLNAHAADPPGWSVMLHACSRDVRDLWDRYWEYTNGVRVDLGLPEIDNPASATHLVPMCRYCNSDPRLGHHLRCRAARSNGFPGWAEPHRPLADGEEWVMLLDPVVDHVPWTAGGAEYVLSPDGKFNLDMSSDVDIHIQLIGYELIPHSMTMSLTTLLAATELTIPKSVVSKFIKQHSPHNFYGHLLSMKFRVLVTIPESNARIADVQMPLSFKTFKKYKDNSYKLSTKKLHTALKEIIK